MGIFCVKTNQSRMRFNEQKLQRLEQFLLSLSGVYNLFEILNLDATMFYLLLQNLLESF